MIAQYAAGECQNGAYPHVLNRIGCGVDSVEDAVAVRVITYGHAHTLGLVQKLGLASNIILYLEPKNLNLLRVFPQHVSVSNTLG